MGTHAVLFTPEQMAKLIEYLTIQELAGLTLEDVIERLRAEEFVEERQVG